MQNSKWRLNSYIIKTLCYTNNTCVQKHIRTVYVQKQPQYANNSSLQMTPVCKHQYANKICTQTTSVHIRNLYATPSHKWHINAGNPCIHHVYSTHVHKQQRSATGGTQTPVYKQHKNTTCTLDLSDGSIFRNGAHWRRSHFADWVSDFLC